MTAGLAWHCLMKVFRISFTTAAFAVSGILVVVGAAGSGSVPTTSPTVRDAPVDFNRDVRPILSEHCYPCHGPDKDATAKTGGYRLDSFEAATRDLGDYFGIAPGSLEDSFLIERIDAEDEDFRMPPVDSNVRPLTAEQRQTLKAWISQGAKYDQHWAFKTPAKPTLPKVENWGWVRNPIDRFVLTGLSDTGFRPAPEADKSTLIRRASLSLTGLPPSIEQIDQFLADTNHDAYEQMIDRLLESPAYGVNQARYWLDAVRYADTQGFHQDNRRSVWPYRDWVVRAFNEDLPYTDFTTWQLAGDLLDKPTLDQQIASGYIRIHPTTNEGGAIAEEYQVRYAFDRVETTSTVFLGVTIGCARCHDHRFDPITQEEYFGMYAFFNSTTENPLTKPLEPVPPFVQAPSAEQQVVLAKLTQQQESLESGVSLPAVRDWVNAAKLSPVTVGAWQKSGVYSAGNFDETHKKVFGPEAGADDVQWTPIEIELGKAIAGVVGADNSAVYLRTTIASQSAQQIELRLGSDDSLRAWLNGVSVHDNPVARGVAPDSDRVMIDLKAGSNELIFKVTNGGGADGFYVAVGDARREAIEAASALFTKSEMTPEAMLSIRQTYLQHGPQNAKPGLEWRKVRRDLTELNAMIPVTLVAQETE